MEDVKLEENEINVETSLETHGDMNNYNNAAESFYNIIEEKLAQLYEYKNNSDLDNYCILCRAIKDEADSLGFINFSKLAAEHEQASKDKNIEYIDSNYAKLKMESIKTLDVLKKYLGK